MLQDIDCDVYDLLDEAYALSLAIHLDAEKAAKVISRLRDCAGQARDLGRSEIQQQLVIAASDLERQLATQRRS